MVKMHERNVTISSETHGSMTRQTNPQHANQGIYVCDDASFPSRSIGKVRKNMLAVSPPMQVSPKLRLPEKRENMCRDNVRPSFVNPNAEKMQ